MWHDRDDLDGGQSVESLSSANLHHPPVAPRYHRLELITGRSIVLRAEIQGSQVAKADMGGLNHKVFGISKGLDQVGDALFGFLAAASQRCDVKLSL